ncbi:MAG: hypothetical protein HY323_14700 [Betaproteobacteria bacterium]|nr:hypothetical protein [Betaproteobacteria bacterium]
MERPVASVPRAVVLALALALAAQIAWQALQPGPQARAEQLAAPAAPAVLRTLSLAEPIVLAQLLTLYLQAFDNQPGISIPFRELDYPRVALWLATILALDPVGQYPLLMASHLYAQVPDRDKQRTMLEFVHRQFFADPDRRWRWLAHAAIMAKHRLNDVKLALVYAEDIARHARAAPSWARQMRVFLLEDLGEVESAKILLGGLLVSGELTDPKEIHFLTERLEQLKSAEKSSPASRN